MNEHLRKIFFPTDEEIEMFKKHIEEIYNSIPDIVELEKDKNSKILLVSKPFQTFKRDCSFCLNYIDSNRGFTEGGDCGKHYIPCGWGFTCKDWKSKSL